MNDRNKGNGVIVAIFLVLMLMVVVGGGVTAYVIHHRRQAVILEMNLRDALEAERVARDEAERAAQDAKRALLEAEREDSIALEGDDLPKNQTTDADESTETNPKD